MFFFQPIEGDSYNVETAMQSAALVITNTTVEKEDEPALVCSITVSLTSPVVRNPVEGQLNKLNLFSVYTFNCEKISNFCFKL